jgi:hypothetical protein
MAGVILDGSRLRNRFALNGLTGTPQVTGKNSWCAAVTGFAQRKNVSLGELQNNETDALRIDSGGKGPPPGTNLVPPP